MHGIAILAEAIERAEQRRLDSMGVEERRKYLKDKALKKASYNRLQGQILLPAILIAGLSFCLPINIGWSFLIALTVVFLGMFNSTMIPLMVVYRPREDWGTCRKSLVVHNTLLLAVVAGVPYLVATSH